MPRLKPNERRQMVKLVRKGVGKKLAAEIFGVSRQTVWKWCKRANHRGRESFKDLPRRSKRRKITQRVENAIVAFRTAFGWGTARIQQALFNIPKFMRDKLKACVQAVRLSRTSINNVLKEYQLNGYGREEKAWKFFRAKKNMLKDLDEPMASAEHDKSQHMYNEKENRSMTRLKYNQSRTFRIRNSFWFIRNADKAVTKRRQLA